MEKKSTPVLLVGAPIQEGFSMKKLLFAVLLNAALVGCAGYVPGRQSYWDAQVKEMCAKDGGVTVYEIVELSEDEYMRLGGMNGGLSLPSASSKKNYHPYFYELIDSQIRESSPTVMRTEMLVIRGSDKKRLGRSVQYFRRGGDFPTGIVEDSTFICPENLQLTNQIFRVKGRMEGKWGQTP